MSHANAPKMEMEAAGSAQVVEKALEKMRLKIPSATAAAVDAIAALQAVETKSKTFEEKVKLPSFSLSALMEPKCIAPSRVPAAASRRPATCDASHSRSDSDLRAHRLLGRPEAIFGFATVAVSLARTAASHAARGAILLPARAGGTQRARRAAQRKFALIESEGSRRARRSNGCGEKCARRSARRRGRWRVRQKRRPGHARRTPWLRRSTLPQRLC
jgi:hypothetical protein